MSFMGLYGYCDIIQSNEFEGLGTGYNYTLEQLNEVNQTVLATLVLPLNDPVLSRNMYISKMLRLPLTMMSRKLDKIVDSTNDFELPAAPVSESATSHDSASDSGAEANAESQLQADP